jgi:predicted kinase
VVACVTRGMSFYVVVRGPLGVGKSTVCRRLAKEIRAEHISIDRILEQHELWDAGRVSEFLRANEFAAKKAESFLARGVAVIFDGNFYWRSVIDDLVRRLNYRHYVFTLRAPLQLCIEPDRRRDKSHGSKAARAVYAKSTRFIYGIGLDAIPPVDVVVDEIISHLSWHGSRDKRRRDLPHPA